MIIKKCKHCGKEFKVSPSYKTTKFCSNSCSMKWQNKYNLRMGFKKSHKPYNTGKKFPKNFKKLSKKCEFCGKIFEIYPSGKKRRFCSISCSSKWGNKHNPKIGYKKGHDTLPSWGFRKNNQYGKNNIGNNYGHVNKGRKVPWTKTHKNRKRHQELMLGKNNPNWKNGVSFEPYPQEFNETLKELIRGRDNYTCQKCGKIQVENGRKLDIHHIDYNKKNCQSNNLISLCASCNSIANRNRPFWTIYFQAILSS